MQATGTGKSYLACKIMQMLQKKKNLIIAPSYYILEQYKKISKENTVYLTYQALKNIPIDEIEKYDVIILDEFHRIGAEKWNEGVQKLLYKNSSAYVVGLSATPIRFLDNQRNMIDELFEGNISSSLSLESAITQGIIPTPTYISALYSLDNIIAEKQSQINKLKVSEDVKKGYLQEIDLIRKNWESCMGIPSILKSHLKNQSNKIIVFFESIEQIQTMGEKVLNWFYEAFSDVPINLYSVHSNNDSALNKAQIKAFEKGIEGVSLLFSVNMLNEGVHIGGITGVVLLRKTISPIIYYQQIGRALQSFSRNQPVIFDFVNNCENISSNIFKESIDDTRLNYLETLKEHGLNISIPQFEIVDLVLEADKLFESLSNKLVFDWHAMLKIYEAYVAEFKTHVVPYECVYKNLNLGIWVCTQRRLYNVGKLLDERFKILNAIGFIWSARDYFWERGFNLLQMHFEEFGHINTISTEFSNRFTDVNLSSWCKVQRIKFKEGKLTKTQINRLKSLGFSFDVLVDNWNQMYQLLLDYKSEFGDTLVPTVYEVNGKKLGNWVSRQRLNKSNLSDDCITKLDAIDFVWDMNEYLWQNGFKAAQLFKTKYGHLRAPETLKIDNINVCSWLATQRAKYKEETLSEEKIEKLNALGMQWDVNEELWQHHFEVLKNYIKDDPLRQIPRTELIDGIRLGAWAEMQRSLYKQNKLSKEKINQLNSISFAWSPQELRWMMNYNALKEYLKLNKNWPKAKEKFKGINLRNWIDSQRTSYKNNTMSEERIKLLKEIDFIFSS